MRQLGNDLFFLDFEEIRRTLLQKEEKWWKATMPPF